MWKVLKWVIGITFLFSVGMTILQSMNETKTLNELKQSDPEAYLVMLKNVNEDKWMHALKEQYPERYKTELQVKVNMARSIPATDMRGNFEAYKKLAKLEPDNKQFQIKVELYERKLESVKKNRKQCNADRNHEAWYFSQYVVRDKLKSPRSAKFSPYRKSKVTYYSNCEFRIEGYVDAQNGFGALIRSDYIAIVNPTPTGWSVRSINIQ